MAARALATAFVNIVPGTKDIDNYLRTGLGDSASAGGVDAGDKMATGLSGSFGSKLKSFVGPLAAGFAASFAAVGIAGFFKDAVTGASDFNEQGGAVSQVFGTAASDIQKFAASGATSMGQSKTQVLEAAKGFGIYGKAAGLAGQDNANFSKDLVGLATDLASFNNTSVDDALLALGSGLRGEAEPLRKYGILLDDATLKAKAMEMGIYDGTGPLTQQQKILAANASIFEQSNTQQGDFARTSAGLANQQRILDANMANLGITVGSFLLPAINGIVSAMNPFISFIADNIVPIGVFAGTLAVLTLAMNAQSIAVAVSTSAWWANAVAMLANPITWIVIGIAAVVAAIVWVATKTTFFQDAWKVMTEFITNAIKVVTAFFQDTWSATADFFGGLWDGVVAVFAAVWDGIQVGFQVAWDAISAIFQVAFDIIVGLFLNWTLPGLILSHWGDIQTFFQTSFDKIGGFFKGLWDGAVTTWNIFWGFISGAAKKVESAFQTAFQNISDFVGKIFNGLVSIIKTPLNSVIGFVNSMIDKINSFSFTVPDWVPDIGGKTIGFSLPHIPALAAGGYVTGPTTALIGEAGPEVVTPLKDFERMMGLDGHGDKGKSLHYYAAPNNSIDSEQALFQAMRRAKAVGSW
jgi:hypothetical protein